MLRDTDREVRQQAADALGNLSAENSIEVLVLALKDEHSSVRQAAARSLRRVNPYWEQSEAARKALPQLRAALNDKNYSVQFAAAEILKAMGDTSTVDRQFAPIMDTAYRKRHLASAILIQMLEDRDPDVRQAAAESLGKLADVRAIEPLSKALDDRNPWVRRAVARSLDVVNWVPPDKELLARLKVAQEKWDEVAGFGAFAIEPLTVAAGLADPETRRGAMTCLASINDPSASEAIASLGNRENPVAAGPPGTALRESRLSAQKTSQS
jgi:HEAT repeat protein